MNYRRTIAYFVSLLIFGAVTRAETITVATYNIENFKEHFLARRLAADKANPLPQSEQATELLKQVRNANDKDCWEISQVILDSRFNPDIMVIEEGCSQEDLEYFNHRWLGDAYQTAIVFPGNSERGQMLGLIAKPGFKVIEKKDQYYLEKDTVTNERGDKLFARGPAFVLMESPGGYRFWVGVTHQKSKSGNSLDVTKWRNREAKRTHEIMKELEKTNPSTSDVVLLGDMNDELWTQEFELAGGGDTITNLVGPTEDGFVLVTRPLIEKGMTSYGGYWNDRFRSFIDHVIVSKSMTDEVKDVQVFQEGMTRVASDHYPVFVKLEVKTPH